MVKTVTRYHDISMGHRVHGHESKCAFLHGHNYRIFFTCTAPELDSVGRIIDFGVIKEVLCSWLEENWDHKFLLWEKDDSTLPLILGLRTVNEGFGEYSRILKKLGIVKVSFNPTAENMGEFLLKLGNELLRPYTVQLVRATVQETRKCSATVTQEPVYSGQSISVHPSNSVLTTQDLLEDLKNVRAKHTSKKAHRV